MDRRDFLKQSAKLAAALCLSQSFAAGLLGGPAYADSRCPYPGCKEAWNYKKLANNQVQCLVCPRGCILGPGELSHCKAKQNHGGVLYSLSYGQISTLHFDPLEKGPLYHVTPGQKALAIGPSGCNLHCAYCQNWQVSQVSPIATKNAHLPIEKATRDAKTKKLSAIVFTYTEPMTYPRYLMDMCQGAKKEGLLTHVVSGGYVNADALPGMSAHVDAFTIGLKGWADSFYNDVVGAEVEPVKKAIKKIASMGKWLEVVTLLVPTKNDDKDTARNIARFIKNEAGSNVPLHFLRFSPAYKMRNLPPTPLSVMEQARDIALDEGLTYVYLGNVPGHEGQNTFCPACKKAVIRRVGFEIIERKIDKGVCGHCGNKLPGLWI
jgi:pyruvate formate lyase activating enzyme